MVFRWLIAVLLFSVSACIDSPSNAAPDAGLKRIALTYDDAPLGAGPRYAGDERTDALIAQLDRAESGPVAIFVTTKGLDLPDGVARINAYAAAGHLIANHSDQHVWASRTPTNDYIADIDQAETKLAPFANRRPWFRFPFLDEGGQGETNADAVRRDALRKALADRDLISGYVTVDTYDWHLDRLWFQAVRSGADVDMQALSQVYVEMVLDAANHYDALGQTVFGRRPAQVLLLHENDLAASFSAEMITALREDGWQIIHPDEAFADPIVDQLPTTRFSGAGRVAALAADAGMRGREVFDHWSASELGIEEKVAAYGAFTPRADGAE
ncbi:MAG: polysaccharide deacetylase family protein [Henriciella sp.]